MLGLRRKRWWLHGLAFVIGLASPAVFATDYALLVGVSTYPGLPEKDWLTGPANDVRLMRQVLLTRGFAASRIQVLADGVADAALPTRNAILDGLDELAGEVGAGDFVYLHFAGHGARQPQGAQDTDVEPDGLDEIFLPRDIGRWDQDIQRVENAISDDEFDRYISAIRRRGAFVWAVFDSCHSGTLMRGAPGPAVRYRRVDEDALGIPAQAMDQAIAAAPAPADTGAAAPVVAELQGGYVAFYAAQTHEQAPELQLPLRQAERDWHGLLSYNVAAVLAAPRSMTYRQAAQRILQQYAATNLRSPTPLFEGSHLDARLLGQTLDPGVPQWPMQVRRNGIELPAGDLAGLGGGSMLAVLAQPQDGTDQALGYLRVISAGPFAARLEAVAHGGLPALERRAIPRHAWARLVQRHTDMGLTVALPATDSAGTPHQAAALATVERLAAQPPSEGIPLTWVVAGEAADVRLALSPTDAPGCPPDRLWLLPTGGELHCGGAEQSHAIGIDREPAQLRALLADSLQRIGRVLNLQRVAAQLAATGQEGGLELVVDIVPRDGSDSYRLTPERIGRLRPGDRMRARAVNHGARPMDLTVLVIDGQYGIQAFYPRDSRTNRIEAAAEVPLFDTRVNGKTQGMEQLLAIAVTARPNSPDADFRFLAQDALVRTRGMGALASLMQPGGGDAVSQRGGAGSGSAARAQMQLVRWRVQSDAADAAR